jgi:hypothetical protein
MTVYIEESEMHDIDVLARTIAHLAGKLSLDDPLRERSTNRVPARDLRCGSHRAAHGSSRAHRGQLRLSFR